MAHNIETGIARIHTAEGKIVGAGFLVTNKWVITCTHVVLRALGLHEAKSELVGTEVSLDFPLIEPNHILKARIILLRPQEEEDITGLELVEPSSTDAKPVTLILSDDLWNHHIRSFGFPANFEDGVWVTGFLRGRQASGWIQIEGERENSYRIEPGFSGGPIWSEKLNAVVGIMVAYDSRRESRAAYAIPTGQFLGNWPALKEHIISAKTEYMLIMRRRCGRFERTFAGSPMNDMTEDSYISQTLAEVVKKIIMTKKGQEEYFEEKQHELISALRFHRKVVIVGRAGRGKTSLLYWTVLNFLDLLDQTGDALVPIYIPLKDYCRSESLETYLHGRFPDYLIFPWLWQQVKNGNILLLLDALDEVMRPERLELLNVRGKLYELIRSLSAPQTRVVMTCRDSVYTDLADRLSELKSAGEPNGFVKLELKSFKPEQIATYAMKFFGDSQRAKLFLEEITKPQQKESGLLKSSRFIHLAEEPMYLHMLCWLWAGMNERQ